MEKQTDNIYLLLHKFLTACLQEKNQENALALVTENFNVLGIPKIEYLQNKWEFADVLQEFWKKCNETLSFQIKNLHVKQISIDIYFAYVTVIITSPSKKKPDYQELSILIEQQCQLPVISFLHVSAKLSPTEQIQQQKWALLNESIAGGMMGGYLEKGYPLYFINNTMLQYLGYCYEEFIQDTKGLVINCIHPEDQKFVENTVEEKFLSCNDYQVRYRMKKRDGSYIWVEDFGRQVTAENGKQAIVSVCFDITQSVLLQKQLEEKTHYLGKKNHQLEDLTNFLPVGIYQVALEKNLEFCYLSKGFLEMVGFSIEEIKGRFGNSLARMIDFKYQSNIVQKIYEASKNEDVFTLEYQLQTKTGLLWVEQKARLVTENDDLRLYCILTDIGQSKQKDETIRSLTNNVPGGVCEVAMNEHYTLLYGNEAFYRLYGYTPKQLEEEKQNCLISVIHPEDIPNINRTVSEAFTQKKEGFEFEKRIFRRNGQILYLLTKGTFVKKNNQIVLNCIIIDITDRKHMEDELRINEERFRIAMEQTTNIVFEYDIIERKIHQPQKASKLYGLPQTVENVPFSLVQSNAVHPRYRDPFLDMYRQIHGGAKNAGCVVMMRIKNNNYIWNKITLTAIYNKSGNPVRAIGVIEDITKQKQAELAFKKEEKYRAAMLFDAVAYYEMNLTADTIEKCGGNWITQIGGLPTKSYTQMLEVVVNRYIDKDQAQAYKEIFSRQELLKAYQAEESVRKMEHKRLDIYGRPFWMLMTMHLVTEPNTGDIKAFAYVRDIDRQKRESQKIEEAAKRDSLTKLYNKGTTEFLVAQYLAEKVPNRKAAFFIIDIDNFKNVNDTLGHIYGDTVLKQMAQSLKLLFRNSDIIGRVGGDEFVVFMKDISDMALVRRKARDMTDVFRQTLEYEGSACKISASIGISLYPEDGTYFQGLFEKADLALYYAKKRGKNQYTVFGEIPAEKGAPSLESKQELQEEQSLKSYRDNIVEYIFKLLYESPNLSAAMDMALDLLGRSFSADRIFILEYSRDALSFDCTHEWCSINTAPIRQDLQSIPAVTWELEQKFYNEDNVCFCSGFQQVNGKLSICYRKSGACPLFLCAIVEKGRPRVIIGIQQNINGGKQLKKQEDSLSILSKIIGIFLMREQEKRRQAE